MDALTLVACAVCALAAAAAPPDLAHIEAFLAHSGLQLRRRYRPLYHVSVPFGWLHDPAAFVYYHREYHLFYQYFPYDGTWGPPAWGHAVSADLVSWAHYPPALLPRLPYERHGCLGGSALVYNGYLAAFYTGEELAANQTTHAQSVAISADGVVFQKYPFNPVIRRTLPMASAFKNPKVWRNRKTWYMIAGNSVGGRGELVLYTAPNLYDWRLHGTVARSLGDMGHLWESPDVFELEGQTVLLLSARGVRPDGFRFRNLHQTGYVVGRFDFNRLRFEDLEVSTATFAELDRGHDFYAAKTVQAADGRRLLVAWLGMWESELREAEDGWAGVATLLREMSFAPDGRLLTPPVREMADLRTAVLEDAWYSPGEWFLAGSRSFELLVNASSAAADVALSLEWGAEGQYSIVYRAARGYVSVDRGGADGERRADWAPAAHVHWRVFVDRSSVELFCGAGEVVFSSRVYPRGAVRVRVAGAAQLHIRQYRLRRSVGNSARLRTYLKEYVLNKHQN